MTKTGWKRLICIAAILALCLFVLGAYAAGSYGTVTTTNVRVRKAASSSADYNDVKLQTGDIVTVGGSTYSASDATTFYLVSYQIAGSDGKAQNCSGYIKADCLSLMNEAEAAAHDAQLAAGTATNVVMSAGGAAFIGTGSSTSTGTSAAPSTPATSTEATTPSTGTPTTVGSSGTGSIAADGSGNTLVSGASGFINAGEVNLREGPSKSSKSLTKLDRNTVVNVLSIPSTIDSDHWYEIQYNGLTGYVMATFLNVTSTGTAVSGSTTTTAPVIAGGTETAAPAITPTPAPAAMTATVAQLVLTSANLRSKPSGTRVAEWVGMGNMLPIAGNPVTKDGYTWYPVTYNNQTLYVRGDCVQIVTAVTDTSGNTTTTTTGTTSSGAPAGSSSITTGANYGTAVTSTSGVNVRNKPAGSSIEQLSLGVTVTITGPSVVNGNYTWYPVLTPSGKDGYIRGDCVTVSYYATPTPAAATPTPAPAAGTTTGTAAGTTATNGFGYVKTTVAKVNLRKSPNGDKIGTVADKNTVVPMTGTVTSEGGYNWYPVSFNGQAGYLRGDCVTVCDVTGGTVGSTQTSTGISTTATYVVTTLDKVNLRSAASKDSKAVAQISINTVMAYTGVTTSGGTKWYHVVRDGKEVWVMGTCVREVTSDEYQAYIAAGGAPVSTVPGSTGTSVQPNATVGYIQTTSSGVNVRATAGGSKVLGRVDKGVIMPFSITTTTKGVTWYYVYTPYGYGYLHGNYVQTCTSDGTPHSYTNTSASTTTSSSTAAEASYSTLKLGSTGSAVKRLVTELKNQGFYSGSVTSTYTSAVRDAVKKFQKSKGISQDGVAGASTQHALFGTVPEGSTDASNLTMAIYPAEKIDWYTGGIQSLWAKGSNYKVYDVKTGIVWWAHRWSGGLHVDAEPLTAADTARLCRIYGVSNAQQIADKNLYQRRPSLVTIGTHTYACSLYGVPHNYPEGDTISANNFKGQLCIHFSNSKTHGTSKVDSGHMEAIQYAYDHAPNGHI